MFEQAVQTSEAIRQATQRHSGMLMPALSGCPACRITHMIAAPALGVCEDCGAELTALGSSETQPAE